MNNSKPPPMSYAERLVGALKVFADQSDVLSVKEIGELLSLPASSAHRVLEPLVELGLLDRAPQRRYRIGTEFFRIAARVHERFELLAAAKPFIADVAEQSGETCLLALLTPSRTSIVLAHKVDTKLPLRFKFDLLTNITPVWGSLGRSIMAWLAPGDLYRIVEEAQPSLISGQPVPDLATLQQDLAEIRRRGVATSKGQRAAPDAVGISAPFFEAPGQVRGAIGVVAPEFRLHRDDIEKIARLVKGAAAQLSDMLGHAGRPDLWDRAANART